MRPLHRKPLLEQVPSSGVRLTRQRRALIEALQGAEEHVDAAALLKLARKRDPHVNRATVYRTLDVLKKLRSIDELDLMHLEGEKHYFEPRTIRDHCHLACLRCGSIVEYTSPAFEALRTEIAGEKSFQLELIRLEVGGVCRHCRGWKTVGRLANPKSRNLRFEES